MSLKLSSLAVNPMATLNDLPNPKFLSLSPTERFELIRSIRTARRIPLKPKLESHAKKTKTPRKPKTQLTGDLAGLSQEQLSQLMELMSNASTD